MAEISYQHTGSDFSGLADDQRRVAVIGSGPTGSTLAILLAQKGYKVDVFEKRADPTDGRFKEEGRSFNLSVSRRAMMGWKRANVDEDIIKSMVPMYRRCVHMPDDTTHYYPYGKSTDCVMSIRRRYIMDILTKKMKTMENINIYFQTQVQNVNLKETTFETLNADGSLSQRKYAQVFGTDGAFSAIQKSYLQTIDFNYSIDFGEYGYIELEIPPNERGEFRHDPNAFHFWPRKQILLAGLPNIENNFTIGLFMKLRGQNSFEDFKDSDTFEKYMHSVFRNTKELMPTMKRDFEQNPVARIIIVKCFPWNKGGFLLLGDAAHAMTPFYGQGLNSGLEDCVILERLVDQYNGHWPTINKKFQEMRKPNADAISQLSSQLFNIMREADVTEGYLLARGLTTYLTETYPGMFRTQQELVYLTDVEFTKCLSYGKVEAQILKEVLLNVPDIKSLMRNGIRDPRVEVILKKYHGLYDLPEGQAAPNELDQILRQRQAEDLASNPFMSQVTPNQNPFSTNSHSQFPYKQQVAKKSSAYGFSSISAATRPFSYQPFSPQNLLTPINQNKGIQSPSSLVSNTTGAGKKDFSTLLRLSSRGIFHSQQKLMLGQQYLRYLKYLK